MGKIILRSHLLHFVGEALSLRFILGYQRVCRASGMFVECNLDILKLLEDAIFLISCAELEHPATA